MHRTPHKGVDLEVSCIEGGLQGAENPPPTASRPPGAST